VSNTSYVDAAGQKALQLSMDIPAPPHRCSRPSPRPKASRAGRWPWPGSTCAPAARSSPATTPRPSIGDPNNIKNQIVTFIPDHLLVIRNIQAPKGFAGEGRVPEDGDGDRVRPTTAERPTRVRLTNTGYGASPEAQTVFGHFEWGNAYTLAELRKRFESGSIDRAKGDGAKANQDADKPVTGKVK
jgi:hypothetical protein